MDKIQSDIEHISASCKKIRRTIEQHHGTRTKHKGVHDEVTLTREEVRALMVTVAEMEVFVEETVKRIAGVEEIVLTHLHKSFNDPSAPGDDALKAAVRKADDEKLEEISSECGMGPNRKVSGVIIHALYS